MKWALVVAMVLLAGCGGPTVPQLAPDAPATTSCPSPCLTSGLRVEMTDCIGISLTMAVPGQPYTLPQGYKAGGFQGIEAQGYQLAGVMLWECQGSDLGLGDLGPTSIGEVRVAVQDPADGQEADLHYLVVEQYATGILLDVLRAQGYPVTEGATHVAATATGREGTIEGTGLKATDVHGPPQTGTFGITTGHHRGPGASFLEVPDCQSTTPFGSAGRVVPGSTALRQADPSGALLEANDSQDDDCDLSFHFDVQGV